MKLTLDRNRWALLLAILTVTLLVAMLRVLAYFQHLQMPLRVQADEVLQVDAGSNLTRVLAGLQQDGVIPSALDLRLHARFNLEGMTLQAGEYLLQPGLTGRGLLEKLARGDVLYHQVRLLEGWTLAQALNTVQAHDAVVPVLRDALDLQLQLGLPGYPEGQFFPDTYNFVRGTTDLDLMIRAHALMTDVLNEAWAARDSGLPYSTPEEALIMASIVEKETAVPAERPQVAGVFVRRLQRGMRLQTDPTVIYGVGAAFDGNLTRTHLQTDTPWNTYTREGLPATPIALPGRGAIEASLHPDESDALYFVARGDGSHQFSSTLQEHNEAVRLYQLGGGAQ